MPTYGGTMYSKKPGSSTASPSGASAAGAGAAPLPAYRAGAGPINPYWEGSDASSAQDAGSGSDEGGSDGGAYASDDSGAPKATISAVPGVGSGITLLASIAGTVALARRLRH